MAFLIPTKTTGPATATSPTGATIPALPKQEPNVGWDIAQSAGAGLRRGIEGFPGMPQDILNIAAIGAAYLSGKLGADPETQQKIRGGLDVPYLPSSEDIHQFTSKAIGPSYEPQTRAGRYAETMGEFAPAFLTGGGGVMKKAAEVGTGMLAGGLSEAGGEATAGTRYEPLVRMVAGLTGAAVPAGLKAGVRSTLTADQRAAEAAAEDAARQHGVNLTAGERRPNDVLQQAKEQEMMRGVHGANAATLMNLRRQQNLAAMKDASQNVMDTAAPTRGATPTQSGQQLQQQLQTRTEGAMQSGGQKIDTAVKSGIMFDADRLRGLEGEIQSKLAGNTPHVPDVVLGPDTPIANQAMDRIRRFASQAYTGTAGAMSRLTGVAAGPTVKEVSMAGIEELRQQLGKLKSIDPEDNRALGKIQKYFDQFYDDITNRSVTSTGPNAQAALADLKAGRAEYREGASVVRPRGAEKQAPGATLIAKIATGDKSVEGVTRLFTPDNAGNLSQPAIDAIRRLKSKGATTEELDQVKHIIMEQLTTGDPGRVVSRVRNFTTKNPEGASLFHPNELDSLTSLADTSKKLVVNPMAMNPSSSAYRLLAHGLQNSLQKLGKFIPLAGPMLTAAGEGIQNIRGSRAAKEALAPVNRDTLAEAMGKGAKGGAGRAGPGAVQGAQEMTINDPGGEYDGVKGRVVDVGENMVRLLMPDGRIKTVGKALVQ